MKRRATKQVSPEDATKIGYAVQLATCFSDKMPFEDALVTACGRLGWEPHHHMTLWTVAMYCDRYPLTFFRNGDGSVQFADACVVLRFCVDPIFWMDPALVTLARRREADVGRRRNAHGMPYNGA